MIYARVIVAMAAAVGLKLALASVMSLETLHVEVHAVGAYLAVIGALYGIIVAFLMFVVWEQFNRVQTGLGKEAAALEDLCRVATFLAARDSAGRIRLAVRHYVKSTVSDEAPRLARGEESTVARDQFAALLQAVRGADVTTGKDDVVFDELLRALARVMEARDDRLTVSVTRIPGTLWNMVVFVSIVVFGGFLVLWVHALWLSLFMVAAVAGSITFLLSTLKDMDNPFVGAWNVSYTVMSNVAARAG
jgi:Protein of unknown function (DUF4239)